MLILNRLMTKQLKERNKNAAKKRRPKENKKKESTLKIGKNHAVQAICILKDTICQPITT